MTALRDLTADEINALAGIIAKLRPHGARRWDPTGIRAALAKAADLDATNVLMAALRLSQDRTAHTPAQIAITTSECWRERLTDPATPAPRQRRYCTTHAVMLDGLGVCASCRADEIGTDGPSPPARPTRGLPAAQIAEVVNELKDIATSTSAGNPADA